jgi:hypothetical protein
MQALVLAVAVAAACEKDPPTTTPPDDTGEHDDASVESEPTEDDPAAEPEPGAKKAEPVQWVLEIDGRVTKAQIDALVQDNLNAIRECYDAALGDPDGIELKGAIVVRFTVAKTGAVGGAVVEHSEFGHPPTETCLVGVVETFALPKQKSESTVKLPLYMNVL